MRIKERVRFVTIEPTPRAMDALRQMVKLGVFGATVSEVALRLVDEGIVRLSKFEPLEVPEPPNA